MSLVNKVASLALEGTDHVPWLGHVHMSDRHINQLLEAALGSRKVGEYYPSLADRENELEGPLFSEYEPW